MGRKKLKQASREALNQEYYQTAATVGDLDLQISKFQRQRKNLIANMGVLLHRIQAIPLSKEAQAEIDAQMQEQVAAETEAAGVQGTPAEDTKDDNGDTEEA